MKGQKTNINGLVVAFVILAGIGLVLFLPMVPQAIFVITGSGHILQVDDNTFAFKDRTSFTNLEPSAAICLDLRDSSGRNIVIPFTDLNKVVYDSNVKVIISSSERPDLMPTGTYNIPDNQVFVSSGKFCFNPTGTIPNWGVCCVGHEGSITGSFDASEAVCGNDVCESPIEDVTSCIQDCGAALPPHLPEPPTPSPTPPTPTPEPIIPGLPMNLLIMITIVGAVVVILIAGVIRSRR